jgi:hypothetical protein
MLEHNFLLKKVLGSIELLSRDRVEPIKKRIVSLKSANTEFMALMLRRKI